MGYPYLLHIFRVKNAKAINASVSRGSAYVKREIETAAGFEGESLKPSSHKPITKRKVNVSEICHPTMHVKFISQKVT